MYIYIFMYICILKHVNMLPEMIELGCHFCIEPLAKNLWFLLPQLGRRIQY